MKNILLATTALTFVFLISKNNSDTITMVSSAGIKKSETHAPILHALPTSAPSLTRNIQQTLQTEALNLNQLRPEMTDEHFVELASSLSFNEAAILKATALDTAAPNNQRSLAVYLLGKRPVEFMPHLKEIAVSDSKLFKIQPRAHSLDEANKEFEVSLRASALSSIDSTNAVTDQRQFFSSLLKHPNITIQQLARVGMMGALKRESMISRYVDAKLEGALHALSN